MTAACPGRSAARSDALQTRDPGFVISKQPGSRISGAPLRFACAASGTRAERNVAMKKRKACESNNRRKPDPVVTEIIRNGVIAVTRK